MHVHGFLLLSGNHLDHYIQYPGYCKKLRHIHAQVQAVSDECPVHAQESSWLTRSYPYICLWFPQGDRVLLFRERRLHHLIV